MTTSCTRRSAIARFQRNDWRKCPRPAAVLLGRDHDVVNALLFRQGQLQRNRLPRCRRAHPARWTTIAAAGRRATGPGSARGCRRPPAAGAERPRSASFRRERRPSTECDMRTSSESPGARRTSRRFSRSSSCRLRNSLEMSARGTSICGPCCGSPRGTSTAAGELQSHELGIGRGGDDDIDAVIGPRRALADHQAAILQPHRARFVGLDPQRPRLGNGPAADGDGAFPEFFASATPSDANHHALRRRKRRRTTAEAEKNRGSEEADVDGHRCAAMVGEDSPFCVFTLADLPGTGAERLRELAEEVPGSEAPVPAVWGISPATGRASGRAGRLGHLAIISRCSRTSLSGHRRLNLLENAFSFPTAGTRGRDYRRKPPCDSTADCRVLDSAGGDCLGLQIVLQWYNRNRPFVESLCHDDQEAQ